MFSPQHFVLFCVHRQAHQKPKNILCLEDFGVVLMGFGFIGEGDSIKKKRNLFFVI